MQLQNGYGVSDATNQHHINIQPHQPHFELFSNHRQPLNFDPSSAFNFTSPSETTGVHHRSNFPSNDRPPPSVLLPPLTLWKPGSENRLSHSPGSTGEVYEEQFAPNPKNQMTRRTGKKKKKKYEDKTCIEEEYELNNELKELSGLIEARLAAHQERLHRRFTEAIDRMERDRMEKEEAWRAAEIEAYRAYAEARARDQALASSREAVIVSCIEKLTGENIGRAVTGLGIGLRRPGQDARLEDDVTPPNSFMYSDVEGDVEYCEEMERNEMLEALLEFKERSHILT